MMLTSAQRAVVASALRDTHGLSWDDAILYADTMADAINALEKRTGEDRAQHEFERGWDLADELGERK